jgi:hypothetical protein
VNKCVNQIKKFVDGPTQMSRRRSRSRFALWGVNRSARVTRAARFGRSLSLPRLERRSMLRAILLVVVLVLDLLSGGQP